MDHLLNCWACLKMSIIKSKKVLKKYKADRYGSIFPLGKKMRTMVRFYFSSKISSI